MPFPHMTGRSAPESRSKVEPDIALAERLFAELRHRTSDDRGVTRASYGPGEELAHALARQEAERLNLDIETDAACNLYITLRGQNDLPRIVIGSHLDSVPLGGNYDGAAGVLAGLAVVSGLIRAGQMPPRAVTVMAIRAEESAWFNSSYIGSRAAFGRLTPRELDTVQRANDNLILSHAIDAAGGRSEALRHGLSHLAPAEIGLFVEPHIEQGPVLVKEGVPIGIVTEIRGSFRYRQACCRGAYAHSGATPREGRQDAVRALSSLIVKLDALWSRMDDAGEDLTVTVGQVRTDPKEASFSKIAGLVEFSLDVRSGSPETLARVSVELDGLIDRISREQKVTFDLGPRTGSDPASMHPVVIAALERAAHDLRIPALKIPSGAGHDAATFAAMGVPTGMLFLRNENGSHNPDEHLDMADFAHGTNILLRLCLAPPDFGQ